MRPIVRLSAAVAVAGLCVGCANPSLDSEADDLRSEITGLPGVTAAHLDYSVPITLDSGKLALKVEMSSAATPDQVVAVAKTAYEAFSTTHRGEEADLSVRSGQTTIALRSFEPDASVTAVDSAVRTGLVAAPESGSVAIDLTTDGVSKGDHVAGTYLVSLPQGSTFADLQGLLASLAGQDSGNTQIGWGGATADGASLSYDSGLPPEQLIGRWERLQETELPLVVRALEEGPLFAEGRLSSGFDPTDPSDRRVLNKITHPQMRGLGDGEWVYTLRGSRGAFLAEIDRFICAPTSEGPYDDELEAWATEEFGPCEGD